MTTLDTMGKLKRKEKHEAELSQLEKDIEKLGYLERFGMFDVFQSQTDFERTEGMWRVRERDGSALWFSLQQGKRNILINSEA